MYETLGVGLDARIPCWRKSKRILAITFFLHVDIVHFFVSTLTSESLNNGWGV